MGDPPSYLAGGRLRIWKKKGISATRRWRGNMFTSPCSDERRGKGRCGEF